MNLSPTLDKPRWVPADSNHMNLSQPSTSRDGFRLGSNHMNLSPTLDKPRWVPADSNHMNLSQPSTSRDGFRQSLADCPGCLLHMAGGLLW